MTVWTAGFTNTPQELKSFDFSGHGIAVVELRTYILVGSVAKLLFPDPKEVVVTLLSVSQHWLRHRGKVKNREEWDDRFEVLADFLVVFLVITLMIAFIVSFIVL